ncbi:hypothetical protein K443DRAFT_124588 [Laccaria amethystina LaAM-08-1]|uniref:PPM-type phosphatase domain-containing protein n=1 Tax=Laccaria amethystina LaAM-08-1 TaxID=1095629 RepID=A0A0C9WKA1_9AGAR|nr:hypothetical protein K443DRAFT_124588 [Laccaria amethystina LaAM-08-1]
MSHDVLSSEDSNPQGPSKDNPSAVFNGIRKDLDKLGKDINDLPDAPGIDNDLSALEKISKDLALLGKGLEELQKSVEALRKDTDAPQSDDDQVMHQALTTHAASAERASTLSSFPAIPPQKTTSPQPSATSPHSWSFFGVFDGHNGPATSAFLNSNLFNAIIGALDGLFSKHAPTIKEAFLRVDDEFVNWALERALEQTSKEAAVSLLATAHAGSCALVGFYESETRLHRIALTRDSRAVLGRKVSRKGKETYEVPEPEITTTEVQPGDCVVLATDGLWDCLTTEELMGWWAPMQCLPTGGA